MLQKLFPPLLLLLAFNTHSQIPNKSLLVKYINEPMVTDGLLDEPVWQTAESANEFWEYFPSDDIQAREQTEIKMLYDDKNLYIGIRVNAAGTKYSIESLKRDFRAGNADNITLLFDTFNDGTNAFLFGTNPYGVLREGLVSGGGLDLRGFTISWDVKWKGEAKMYDDHYIAELTIPLTSFKFEEGTTKWRFNSYRFDTQSNETSTWMNIPQNQNVFGLTFMGDMIFEKPLGKSRTPMALIPYINAITENDREAVLTGNGLKVGGDAKISIGNSMNLDITVNPDFSQVEVDDQVTNLTRFEVSLPEKRQFFIDNSDLFSSFGGSRDANPFFSRRIGIAVDTADNSIENRIIGGLRLSGKLNKDLRVGLLNIQTASDVLNKIPSNNNTMLAIQQKVFSRSNVSLFFINKQSFKDYDFVDDLDKYNRVLGVDYNLVSKDNIWNGKYYLHKSFQPEIKNKDLSAGAFLGFNSRKYNIFSDWVYVGENFRSDLGFIRRNDILKVATQVERIFWSSNGVLNSHGFKFFPIIIWRPELNFKISDYNIMTGWQAKFNDQSELQIEMANEYVYLVATDEFEPTGEDGALLLPTEQGYYNNGVTLDYRSDRRKVFSYGLKPSLGTFYNGRKFSTEGMMTMRVQPIAFISMLFGYDHIKLPEPYASADIWLISPKVEITFSKTLYWSTLIQYSNQRDNLGFNSRLQWRFAPLSDLFLVYNDNYFVDLFSPRYRSINLKLTYWLNI
ncbi:MAG: carbohydrate binding family 9 domain-containing protein [Maribacter sp.]|nr:carbohydrate binding family 9 domain-containing protein [Maribacter sp.]